MTIAKPRKTKMFTRLQKTQKPKNPTDTGLFGVFLRPAFYQQWIEDLEQKISNISFVGQYAVYDHLTPFAAEACRYIHIPQFLHDGVFTHAGQKIIENHSNHSSFFGLNDKLAIYEPIPINLKGRDVPLGSGVVGVVCGVGVIGDVLPVCVGGAGAGAGVAYWFLSLRAIM